MERMRPIQRAFSGAVPPASAFRALGRSVASPPAGDAALGPLLDHIPADERADPIARDRVEDVLLLLRVRANVHPVQPDLEDRGGESTLIVKPHSVTIRLRMRSLLSSQAFSISSRFRVPTP